MNSKRWFIAGLLCILLAVGALLAPGCRKSDPAVAPAGNASLLDLYDSYFTPYDPGVEVLLELLNRALEPGEPNPTVHIAAFTYTDEAITNKLIELEKKGVQVYVILDKRQVASVKKEQPLIDKMLAGGVEVVIGSSEGGDIMHLKLIVVNKKWNYLGSFNLTPNANRQDNFLLISKKDRPDPRMSEKILKDWEKMRDYMMDGTRTLKRRK